MNPRCRVLHCAMAAALVAASGTPVEAQEVIELRLGGRLVLADVYAPPSPRGTAIVVHGFLRDRGSMRKLAAELAGRGVLVVVPDLPFLADAVANGGGLADLVAGVRGGRFGAVPARTVLIGFSAGGLASLLAAARTPGLSGWIGLDPVDRSGEGLHAAARVTAPALMLRAAPNRCNAYANSHSWGSFLPRLSRDALIEGATHCDFEDAEDVVCAAVCGAADPRRQAAIRAEVAEAVDQWLK